jgi:hypothetical protein
VAHASVLTSVPSPSLGVPLTPGATSPGGADLSRNPFLALDSSDAPDATKGLSGLHGPQIGSPGVAGRSSSLGGQDGGRALEVGYQDPALGYVELRAHTEGAGIHASLTTQSADSGATLEAHLSSLAGWMNERRTPVESLTVSSLAPRNAGESGHSGPARHDSQGDSQGDSQRNAQNGNNGAQHGSLGWSAGEVSTFAASSVAGPGSSRASGLVASLTEEPRLGPERSGSSISVVA